MKQWDSARIATLSSDEIKNLRKNAETRKENHVVTLCDEELKARKRSKIMQPRSDEPVCGFHFVCENERGVTRNLDGTIWSGTWVVDKRHAEHGVEISAYVALHKSRSEKSYLQGLIKGWRSAPREKQYGEEEAQTHWGIDFLIEPTGTSYDWVGDGTGEKGYARRQADGSCG